MTSYPRSAYKNPWPAGTSPNGAKARGWGSGWPNCQPGKMKTIVAQDQTKGENYDIRVTVRAEIAQMVADLLEATDKVYDLSASSTGAYNCRPIAGTNIASNHSWGLAVDMNWNDNPMTSNSNFHSEIPPQVVAMWSDCGFFWGGFYANKKDTMHFEYIGTPASVAKNAAKAAAYNKGSVKPTIPKPAPAPGTVVSLAVVLKAALADPNSTTGIPTAGAKEMVKVVEDALVAEGLLDAQYADGLFGSKTISAYRAYQLRIGLKGKDADGTPGEYSLGKLAAAHKFTVIK